MDIESLLRSLRDRAVEFVVIGAQAFPVHGYSRSTLDIDLFIRPDRGNAQRTLDALRDFGYDVADLSVDDLLTKKVLIRQYIVETDIHPFVEGATFDQVWRNKVEDLYEKPDPLTAAEFLLSGKYSWNSGMLIWRADLALEEFRRQTPTLGEVLDHLASALGGPDQETVMERWWPECPKLSVDQAIMAGAGNMVIIPADIGWSDIGSWTTLYDVLKLDEGENVTQGDMPLFVPLWTKGTFALSRRMVVTIGVEDLVIVDTDDVLLICRRDQSEDVRRIVDLLKEWGRDDYL